MPTIDPNRSCPTAVREAITQHGGSNPYGRPMWRLILAQDRLTSKRGIWHEFADGSIEQFNVENGQMHYNPLTALRVIQEVRETPMYPHKGWILERWMPPSVWGTKSAWSADWGPYPDQGDYFLLGGPWEQMPELWDLRGAIDMWNREWEAKPRDFETAFRIWQNEERASEEKQLAKLDEELSAFYRGEIKPIFNSTSLEAQRIRNECQAAIGEKSHLGAGQ